MDTTKDRHEWLQITARLPPELLDKLDGFAQQTCRNRAEALRFILASGLKRRSGRWAGHPGRLPVIGPQDESRSDKIYYGSQTSLTPEQPPEPEAGANAHGVRDTADTDGVEPRLPAAFEGEA